MNNDHRHTYVETTRFKHNEKHFRCVECGAEITEPFPTVNPYTGVIASDTEHGFTREDVRHLRLFLRFEDEGPSSLQSIIERMEAQLDSLMETT